MTLDTYSILLDANIHLSKTLRDWIYLLSFATEEQVYEIFHTRDIQAEVDYHTRRKFPDADGNLLDRWWKHLEKMTTSKMITGFTVDPIARNTRTSRTLTTFKWSRQHATNRWTHS